jgi:hypothetical protein
MHAFGAVVLLVAAPAMAGPSGDCGEVVTIETHGGTTTRYSLAHPAAPQSPRIALVLLAGGSGLLDLDERGCPRALKRNSLVVSLPDFHAGGFVTALVDAPSDRRDGDGLGAFRLAPRHAENLGKVIADVRAREHAAVWLVGTSRGAISAVNAATHLDGASLPDGLVLTSPVTNGQSGGWIAWASQSVFDVPLERIRMPLLVIGHADDTCFRSPPERMQDLAARTSSARKQVVVVTGGRGNADLTSTAACEGRSPHQFVGQEAEVAAGIARFVRGGAY